MGGRGGGGGVWGEGVNEGWREAFHSFSNDSRAKLTRGGVGVTMLFAEEARGVRAWRLALVQQRHSASTTPAPRPLE